MGALVLRTGADPEHAAAGRFRSERHLQTAVAHRRRTQHQETNEH